MRTKDARIKKHMIPKVNYIDQIDKFRGQVRNAAYGRTFGRRSVDRCVLSGANAHLRNGSHHFKEAL